MSQLPHQQQDHAKAFWTLVVVAALWSLGGLFIKLAEWNPLGIAGGRSLVAFMLLWAFSYRGRRLTFNSLTVAGAIFYCLTLATFVAATRMTTAANAIVLQYSAPIYVLLFGAWFLGERARWFDWITVIVALGGMALFFFDQLSAEGLAGNLFGVGSGMAFAGMVIILRRQKNGDPLGSILLGNALTALLMVPAFAISLPASLVTIGIIVLLGSVQIALPYYLYSKAIRQVSAFEAILIPFIEPLLNPLWVLLFLGESPSALALLGAAVVLISVLVRGLAGTRYRLPKAPLAAVQ